MQFGHRLFSESKTGETRRDSIEPREYKALATVFQTTRLAVRPMTLALHEESLFRSAVPRHLGLISQSPLLEVVAQPLSLVDFTSPRHIFCHSSSTTSVHEQRSLNIVRFPVTADFHSHQRQSLCVFVLHVRSRRILKAQHF